MAWYAKPSGGYGMSSTEGTANIYMMHDWMSDAGYTLEAQAAVVANCVNESALNPWRWQYDTVSYSAGYGLFQFTPASDYINGCTGISGYAPNLSVSYQTDGASPNDGNAQMFVLINDVLEKWTPYCWRPSYWAEDSYLWGLREQIVTNYGYGNGITQAQFAAIDDIELALFCFFACYEGPLEISGYYARIDDAYTAYSILSGAPTPTGNIPVWLLFKLRENNFRRKR